MGMYLTDDGHQLVEVKVADGSTAFAVNGTSALTILASAGVGLKNRIFKVVLTAVSAGTLTISDGFGAVYLPANGSVVLDFGPTGKLQATAATAITATNSGTGNVSAHGSYRKE